MPSSSQRSSSPLPQVGSRPVDSAHPEEMGIERPRKTDREQNSPLCRVADRQSIHPHPECREGRLPHPRRHRLHASLSGRSHHRQGEPHGLPYHHDQPGQHVEYHQGRCSPERAPLPLNRGRATDLTSRQTTLSIEVMYYANIFCIKTSILFTYLRFGKWGHHGSRERPGKMEWGERCGKGANPPAQPYRTRSAPCAPPPLYCTQSSLSSAFSSRYCSAGPWRRCGTC